MSTGGDGDGVQSGQTMALERRTAVDMRSVCRNRSDELESALIQTDGHGSKFPEAPGNPSLGGASGSVSACSKRFRATALQEIRAGTTPA